MLIVITMTPQINLRASFLDEGSQAWDFKRMAGAMHGMSSKFRITSAFEGTRALTFFDQIKSLFMPPSPDQSSWQVLSESQRSRAASSTAFAMLAKACCGFHHMIFTVQHGYPYKLFGIVLNPDLVDEIIADSHPG